MNTLIIINIILNLIICFIGGYAMGSCIITNKTFKSLNDKLREILNSNQNIINITKDLIEHSREIIEYNGKLISRNNTSINKTTKS